MTALTTIGTDMTGGQNSKRFISNLHEIKGIVHG